MSPGVTIRGSGTAEIAAYGIADAEARVAKEIEALLPGADVRVLEIRRVGEQERIVDEFEVRYSIRVTVPIDVEGDGGPDGAHRRAFAAARAALEGSRFARTAWDRAVS